MEIVDVNVHFAYLLKILPGYMFRAQFGHHQALNEHISSNQTHWV
jgi:hypothetical protein